MQLRSSPIGIQTKKPSLHGLLKAPWPRWHLSVTAPMERSLQYLNFRFLTSAPERATENSLLTAPPWRVISQNCNPFLLALSTGSFAVTTDHIPTKQDGGPEQGRPYRECAP